MFSLGIAAQGFLSRFETPFLFKTRGNKSLGNSIKHMEPDGPFLHTLTGTPVLAIMA
jgi:hypothetical protein